MKDAFTILIVLVGIIILFLAFQNKMFYIKKDCYQKGGHYDIRVFGCVDSKYNIIQS